MKTGGIIARLIVTTVGLPAKEWTAANLAGIGSPSGTNPINDPYGLVRGPDGAIWFCEHNGHRISRLAPDGSLSVIAGTGTKGYSGDGGPASQATFQGPHSIQFDAAGQLYVCDVGNHAIRRIDPKTGIISTIAGTGKAGPTPDGAPLVGTPFNNPRSLDLDAQGNPWIVTREGNQVFKLDLKAGVIRLMAGTGQPGFTGNGGPALAATLSGPKGIALDAAGNAWLVDTESHSIRRINAATGKLELMLGTGARGDGPVGKPTDCALNRPHGVFVDTDGSILIGDSEAHRIRVLRSE